MGNGIITGLKRLTLVAAAGLVTLGCFAAGAPASAGVPVDNSVLLDPFDPVPQIGFRHGECDDPCGYHRCEHDCYRHRRCDRDCCGRDCDFYSERREAWARYWRQANTYDVIMAIYMDQLRWYEWRYRDGGHGTSHREDFDGHHDGDHHDGDHHDADHHDGDWHDGDHHDGDHHDADHHDGHWQDRDGNWHDGDRHDGDGDHHDGDHHDGDHHDGHHDGEWQDSDGNWHEAPPPDGYGH